MKKIIINTHKLLFLNIIFFLSIIFSILENNYLLNEFAKHLKKEHNINFDYSKIHGGVFSGIKIKDFKYKDINADIEFNLDFKELFFLNISINQLKIDNFLLKKPLENYILKEKTKYETKKENDILLNNLKINKVTFNNKSNTKINFKELKINKLSFEIDKILINFNNLKNTLFKLNHLSLKSNLLDIDSKAIFSKKEKNAIFDINIKSEMLPLLNKDLKFKNKENIFLDLNVSNIMDNKILFDYKINTKKLTINNIMNEFYIKSKTKNSFNLQNNEIKLNNDITIDNNFFFYESKDNKLNIKLNDINNTNVNISNKIILKNKKINKILNLNKELKVNVNLILNKIEGELKNLKIDNKTFIDLLWKEKELSLKTKNKIEIKEFENLNIKTNLKSNNYFNLDINAETNTKISDLNNTEISLQGNITDLKYDEIFKELSLDKNITKYIPTIKNEKITFKSTFKNNKIESDIESKIISENGWIDFNSTTKMIYLLKENILNSSTDFINKSKYKIEGNIKQNNNKILLNNKIKDFVLENEIFDKEIKKELPLYIDFNSTIGKEYNIDIYNNNSKIDIKTFDFNKIIIKSNLKKYYDKYKIQFIDSTFLNIKDKKILSDSTIYINDKLEIKNRLSNKRNYIENRIYIEDFLESKSKYYNSRNTIINYLDINLNNLNDILSKLNIENNINLNGKIKLNNIYKNHKIKTIFNEIDIKTEWLRIYDLIGNIKYDIKNKSLNSDKLEFNISGLDVHSTVDMELNKKHQIDFLNLKFDDNGYFYSNLLLDNINTNIILNEKGVLFKYKTFNKYFHINEYSKVNVDIEGSYRITGDNYHYLNSNVKINDSLITYDISNFNIETDNDIIILKKNGDKEKKYPLWENKFYMDINVSNVERKMNFKNDNINIHADGKIQIKKDFKKQIYLKGSINNINGHYINLDKKFKILDSNVIFNKGLEPLLDIKTEYKINEVTIYINIKGTQTEPIINLNSDPIMEETDIYSYLLFGKPSSELSDTEKEDGNSDADLSLLFAGNKFTKEVAESLGIDKINIFMNENTVGYQLEKSLTDKITIKYKTIEDNNEFIMEYKIDDKFGLESNFGETNGINIFYKNKYR